VPLDCQLHATSLQPRRREGQDLPQRPLALFNPYYFLRNDRMKLNDVAGDLPGSSHSLAAAWTRRESRHVEAKDYALAEAARPVFGLAGFSIVAIAALVSTASSINANLYAVTNVTYQLAKEGELPAAFGQPIGRSREGLLISAGLIILLGHALDLSEIAAVGSITVLIVHLMVHLGHLRLLRETGASATLVLTAIVLILVAIVFASVYALQTLPHVLWLVAGSLVAAAILEMLLHRLTGRRIQTRTPEPASANRDP